MHHCGSLICVLLFLVLPAQPYLVHIFQAEHLYQKQLFLARHPSALIHSLTQANEFFKKTAVRPINTIQDDKR